MTPNKNNKVEGAFAKGLAVHSFKKRGKWLLHLDKQTNISQVTQTGSNIQNRLITSLI
uniref:Uncharacterized protein n=1 Tax=Solanum tuberosum TaxID=4113 RepID=M1CCA6_SOLTU